MAATKDLVIRQGRTFSLPVRWEAPPIVYKQISAILQSAPVRITAVGHGVPDGWRVAVTNVKGMVEINAEANKVRDKDYVQATVIDPDTVELNAINASGFRPYTSGGVLQYNTPVVLTGFTARMSIKDRVGGTELLSLTTENGGIVIDLTRHTITIKITAAATAALSFKSAVYDLEIVSPDVVPVITPLLSGKVSVTLEVTT
jgi:hypothetical protein